MDSRRYLLDTNALIWFQEDSSKMSRFAFESIVNPGNTILFSQISLFEISIKLKIGKLSSFKASLKDVYNIAKINDFKYVPIKNEHIFRYQDVPLDANHRDPFDRLLIATAHKESAIIISADQKLRNYTDFVEILW